MAGRDRDRYDRRQRGGCDIDQIVSEKNHAEQFVGLIQQRLGQHCAPMTGLGCMPEAIAVDGHHRRFGCRKAGRHEQQDCKQAEQGTDRQRFQGYS